MFRLLLTSQSKYLVFHISSRALIAYNYFIIFLLNMTLHKVHNGLESTNRCMVPLDSAFGWVSYLFALTVAKEPCQSKNQYNMKNKNT